MKTLLTALLLVLSTCALAHPQRITTIVIDTWWDHDYAKENCNGADQRRIYDLPADKKSCNSTMINTVENFERKIMKNFTASTVCKGLNIYTLRNMPKGMGELWYNLSVNYTPHFSKQSWQIVQNGKTKLYDNDGTAKEIAKDVCSFAKM